MEELSSLQKARKPDREAIESVEEKIDRHKRYTSTLQDIIQYLDEGRISVEDVNEIKDGVEYYIEAYADPDYIEDESIFENIMEKKEKDDYVYTGGEGEDGEEDEDDEDDDENEEEENEEEEEDASPRKPSKTKESTSTASSSKEKPPVPITPAPSASLITKPLPTSVDASLNSLLNSSGASTTKPSATTAATTTTTTTSTSASSKPITTPQQIPQPTTPTITTPTTFVPPKTTTPVPTSSSPANVPSTTTTTAAQVVAKTDVKQKKVPEKVTVAPAPQILQSKPVVKQAPQVVPSPTVVTPQATGLSFSEMVQQSTKQTPQVSTPLTQQQQQAMAFQQNLIQQQQQPMLITPQQQQQFLQQNLPSSNSIMLQPDTVNKNVLLNNAMGMPSVQSQQMFDQIMNSMMVENNEKREEDFGTASYVNAASMGIDQNIQQQLARMNLNPQQLNAYQMQILQQQQQQQQQLLQQQAISQQQAYSLQALHNLAPAPHFSLFSPNMFYDTLSYKLALSHNTIPNPTDCERPNHYFPLNPYSTPDCFPSQPASIFNDPTVYSKMELDTLFFAFYYQQGTYQQLLASKELKKQSWRYHKKYMTWFQRHDQPKQTTPEFEVGTYVYFDYEAGWCQRIKSQFRFEYSYLE